MYAVRKKLCGSIIKTVKNCNICERSFMLWSRHGHICIGYFFVIQVRGEGWSFSLCSCVASILGGGGWGRASE